MGDRARSKQSRASASRSEPRSGRLSARSAAGMLAAGLLGFICGFQKGRGGLDSASGRSSADVAPTECAVSHRPAANVHHFFSMATTDDASTIKNMITGKVAHHSYEQMYGHFAMYHDLCNFLTIYTQNTI